MQPILSTPITLPMAQRKFSETMYLILGQISQATGFRIRLGGDLSDFVLSKQTTIRANNEPATLVVIRLLESVDTDEGKRDPTKFPASSYNVGYFDKFFAFRPGTYGLSVHTVSRPGALDPRYLPRPTPPPPPAPPRTGGRIDGRKPNP